MTTRASRPTTRHGRSRPSQPSRRPAPPTTAGHDDGDKNGGDTGGDDKNTNGGGDKNGGDTNGDGDKAGSDGDKNSDGDSTGTVPQIPVYVFNQTKVTGLAGATAGQLEADGWNVVGVDNWVGTVPEDTVYYYPGERAAAERLVEDIPSIRRVWPASAPMPQGALTVILADADRK